MADQPSIFGTTQNPEATPQSQPAGSNPAPASQDNTFADLLGSIKNERGEPKYRDVKTALEALQHSQEFIPSLKAQADAAAAEAQRLREENQRLKTIEETVAALTSQQQAQGTPPAAGLDAEAIADLVNRTLTQKEQKALAEANAQSVVSSLQSAFGTDAEKKYIEKATEMGMSIQEMNALAARSPKAVLSMLGVTGQAAHKQQPTVTTSTVNTSAFQPQQETYVGRNSKSTLIGATSQDLLQESHASRKMVDELHAQGKSVHDLTDPKVYAKFFNTRN